MALDLSAQTEIVQQTYGYALQEWGLTLAWLLSPAAWAQCALLVATHAEVLGEPCPPDCESRGSGENGIDFAVKFRVNGLDDGPYRYTSDVRYLIWNALKDAGIEIPYPQRVVEIKGALPGADA